MESGYAYPERSEDNLAAVCENAKAETDVRTNNNIRVSSEVSRGHSKPATSHNPNKWSMRRTHVRTKD
jgi:hypothetical protein